MPLGAQVINIPLGKMQGLQVFDHLLQPSRNGKAAAIWNFAKEQVKAGQGVLPAVAKIAVGHGQLIKIGEHGKIAGLFLALVHQFIPLSPK